jgi:hypothetical protein
VRLWRHLQVRAWRAGPAQAAARLAASRRGAASEGLGGATRWVARDARDARDAQWVELFLPFVYLRFILGWEERRGAGRAVGRACFAPFC